MTSNWSNLPVEILEMIFEVHKGRPGHQKELLRYERVCKGWKLPAQRLAYTSIILEYSFARIFNNAEPPVGSVTGCTRVANEWFKSLDRSGSSPWNNLKLLNCTNVWSEYTVANEKRVLDNCADAFPNVEQLQINEADTNLYLNLIQLGKDNKWTRLRSIPQPEEDEHIPAFVACQLEFSKSLSQVLLVDRLSPVYDFDWDEDAEYHTYSFNSLAKRLHLFNNLTSLDIVNHSNEDIETFDEVVQSCCNSLKSISYQIYRPKTTSEYEFSSSVVKKLVDLSTVVAQPQITKIEITARIHTNKTLQYLMLKYPNPTSFKVNVPSIISIYNQIGMGQVRPSIESKFTFKVLSDFLFYLGKIQQFDFRSIYVDKQVLFKVLTKYWNSRPNIENDVAISFDVRNKEQDLPDTDIMLFKFNRTGSSSIKTCLDYNWNNMLAIMDTIETLGCHFKQLQFSGKLFEAVTGERGQGQIINHILNHCLRLEKLELAYLQTIEHCNIVHQSISYLTLQGCYVTDTLFGELSQQLPSLTRLNLSNCKFADLENKDTLNLPIVMKHTRLEHLNVTLYGEDKVTGVVHIQQEKANGCGTQDKYFKTAIDPERKRLWKTKDQTLLKKITPKTYQKFQKKKDKQLHIYIKCISVRNLEVSIRFRNP